MKQINKVLRVRRALAMIVVIVIGCSASPQAGSFEDPVCVDAAGFSKERQWSQALADRLGGDHQVSVDFGRADVVTKEYAIEVDWFVGNEWHNGIGQALHYAHVTGREPVLALIVKPGSWPLSLRERRRLHLVRTIAKNVAIRVMMVRDLSTCPASSQPKTALLRQ